MTKKVVKAHKRVHVDTSKAVVKTRKPYESLTPGTPEWMECWKKNPKLQKDMAVFRDKLEKEGKKVERKRLVRKITGLEDFEEQKKKRAEELRLQEEFIKRNGVQTRRPKGVKVDDDDDNFAIGEEEEVPVKKAAKVVKTAKKEAVMKKSPKTVKKAGRGQTEEIVKTVGQAFGAEGRTFDLYAKPIPKNVNSVKQLTAWLREEGRTIIEFKDGELRAYEPERVTSTGRVAKVTVKKTGNKHSVTYRSNKNSRVVE